MTEVQAKIKADLDLIKEGLGELAEVIDAFTAIGQVETSKKLESIWSKIARPKIRLVSLTKI